MKRKLLKQFLLSVALYRPVRGDSWPTSKFISVQSLSRVQLFAFHGPQHARPPCPSLTSGVYSVSCALNQWCHPSMSSSVIHFSCCPQSFPMSGSFQMSQQRIGHQMDMLGFFAVQGTHESSPIPQFKNINSSALSFLYSPTLTSINDYWKNHDFD